MISLGPGSSRRILAPHRQASLDRLAARAAGLILLVGLMLLPPLLACDLSIWLGCQGMSRSACIQSFSQALAAPELVVSAHERAREN